MKIHDIGPRTDVVYPPARKTPWSEDYGKPGLVERDRPYFDDQPADRHGWEAPSRWGSRPVRDSRNELGRGRATVTGFFKLAWARATSAVRVKTR